MNFAQSLANGKIGEGRIARWLVGRGYQVLPVYEKEIHDGKGPVLFTVEWGTLIAPDLFIFRNTDKDIKFVEAKTKSGFTWHRITERWTTGIDLRHYGDYLKVSEISPFPVWLLFLHTDTGGAKDTPISRIGTSPVGLFGNDIVYLSQNENHRHQNYGSGGMVYWSVSTLRKVANIEDVPTG